MLDQMERAAKLEGNGRPQGESGGVVSAAYTDTHPFFVKCQMLKGALLMQLFFVVVTPIMIWVINDNNEDDDDDDYMNSSAAHGAARTKTNMNMALFAFSFLVTLVVLFLHHAARVEEVIMLEAAARAGEKKLPSMQLLYSTGCVVTTIALQLIAVIIDLKSQEPLGTFYLVLVALTASFLVLLAFVCVSRLWGIYAVGS